MVSTNLVALRLKHDDRPADELSEVETLKRQLDQALATLAEQRVQIATLVGVVRETIETVAGERASFHQTLTGSTQRFEKIALVDDLHQIQAELVREVKTLKQVTIERHNSWEQMFQEFGKRVTTLESQLDDTRREAALDPLTNVPNRRTFERTCGEWLQPHRPGFVLAMVDVDDFKKINDTHGHAAGDRVLTRVAETLGRSLRNGDVVARVGGDEFAVLASGLTLDQARIRFAAIAKAVREACPITETGPATASISIGIAERSAGDTRESLQHRADTALYQAKRNGKGRVAAEAAPLIRDLLAHGGRTRL
jgi:diguanylate cyclase